MSSENDTPESGTPRRLGTDDGTIRVDSSGTVHIEVDGDLAFTEYGERRVVLCGAALSGGGLDLEGMRLVDEYRLNNLCETCLDRLPDMGVTIPAFMSGGEVQQYV